MSTPGRDFFGTMHHAESFHQECLAEEGIPKALGDDAALMRPAPPAGRPGLSCLSDDCGIA